MFPTAFTIFVLFVYMKTSKAFSVTNYDNQPMHSKFEVSRRTEVCGYIQFCLLLDNMCFCACDLMALKNLIQQWLFWRIYLKAEWEHNMPKVIF